MEPDIEGNDNDLMHLARGKETESVVSSVNQHTITDIKIIQIKGMRVLEIHMSKENMKRQRKLI